MLTACAYGLTILLAAGIIFIGFRFLLMRHAAAVSFGLPFKGPTAEAYLATKGLRDLTYGILGIVLLAVASTQTVGWFLIVTATVPIGDSLIVLRYGGKPAVALGIHLATAVAMLIAAALLFAL